MTAPAQTLDRPVIGRVYPRSVATFERVSRMVHEWDHARGKVLVGVSTVTVILDPQA